MRRIRTYKLVLVVAVLQVLGAVCGVLTAEALYPDFYTYNPEPWDQWKFSMFMKQFSLRVVGYLPFFFASAFLLLTHEWEISEALLAQLKDVTAVTTLVLGVFFISGGASYISALAGLPVYIPDVPAFDKTPFAMILVAMGTMGLLMISDSWRHLNPNPRRAWLRLFLGMSLIVLSWVYLEVLLLTSYTK